MKGYGDKGRGRDRKEKIHTRTHRRMDKEKTGQRDKGKNRERKERIERERKEQRENEKKKR